MAAVPELFRHYPTLRTRLPWTALARPTPVERLAVPPHWSPGTRLWVKRDDQTSDVCGGHAAREFEFILGEALRRGAQRLLYFGDASSDQGFALASMARNFEIETILALGGHPDGARKLWLRDQERRWGVQLHPLFRGPWEIVPLLRHCLTPGARRRRPWVPVVLWPGRASLLEALGASNGIFELQRQIRCGLLPEPELIFVGTDSLPTLAGLAAGTELAGLRSRLVTLQPQQVRPARQLAQRLLRFLQRRVPEIPRRSLRADRIESHPEPDAAASLPDSLAGLDLGTAVSLQTMQALLADSSRGLCRGPRLFWQAEAPWRLHPLRPSERLRRSTPAHA